MVTKYCAIISIHSPNQEVTDYPQKHASPLDDDDDDADDGDDDDDDELFLWYGWPTKGV